MLDSLPVPPVAVVVIGGLVGGMLLVVQMLVGYRKIKFKGRTHLKVHKALGWAILLVALAHGLLALDYVGWWPFDT